MWTSLGLAAGKHRLIRRLREPPLTKSDMFPVFTPQERMDLMFARAKLGNNAPVLWESRWPDFKTPERNVLWPHPLLDLARRRGFHADSSGTRQIQENQRKVEGLWFYLKSYGFSWDEIDQIYADFVESHHSVRAEWERQKSTWMDIADDRARHFMGFKLGSKVKSEESNLDSPVVIAPGVLRRMRAKYYWKLKREYLRPWQTGQLSLTLRNFVAQKMVAREILERSHKLKLDTE